MPAVQGLDDVIALIQKHASPTPNNAASLALVGIVDGLSMLDWQDFVTDKSLQNWLAIPLEKNKREAVKSILDLQTRLAFVQNHDPLTGLANQELFNATCKTECIRAQHTNSALSLLLISINNHEEIAQQCGEGTRDIVLQRIASLMAQCIQAYDTLARIDEGVFGILLPATTCWAAEHLARALTEHILLENFNHLEIDFPLSCSTGITCLALLDFGITSDQMIQHAQLGLAKARKQGNNSTCIAPSDKLTRDQGSLVQQHEKQLLFSTDKLE